MKKQPKVLGVVPARLGSTRLKRKMLVEINGKPLVWHTWNQAKKSKKLDAVVVATDSAEIRDALLPYGASVMMTSEKINTGSDRVATVAKKFKDFKPDIVLNIQGDQPMIPTKAVDQTAQILIDDPKAVMSTIATEMPKRGFTNPGMVKVVLDKDSNALYFSRSLIPFPREETNVKVLWHFGIYGYRAPFLETYVKLKQTPLEKAELLEQLRVLENGYKIKVGVGKYYFEEVNVREELELVRKLLKPKKKKH